MRDEIVRVSDHAVEQYVERYASHLPQHQARKVIDGMCAGVEIQVRGRVNGEWYYYVWCPITHKRLVLVIRDNSVATVLYPEQAAENLRQVGRVPIKFDDTED